MDYKNAMKWLTSKNRATVEDASYFERLDAMMGKASGKSLETRAKSMAKALQWVRTDADKQRKLKENENNNGRISILIVPIF